MKRFRLYQSVMGWRAVVVVALLIATLAVKTEASIKIRRITVSITDPTDPTNPERYLAPAPSLYPHLDDLTRTDFDNQGSWRSATTFTYNMASDPIAGGVDTDYFVYAVPEQYRTAWWAFGNANFGDHYCNCIDATNGNSDFCLACSGQNGAGQPPGGCGCPVGTGMMDLPFFVEFDVTTFTGQGDVTYTQQPVTVDAATPRRDFLFYITDPDTNEIRTYTIAIFVGAQAVPHISSFLLNEVFADFNARNTLMFNSGGIRGLYSGLGDGGKGRGWFAMLHYMSKYANMYGTEQLTQASFAMVNHEDAPLAAGDIFDAFRPGHQNGGIAPNPDITYQATVVQDPPLWTYDPDDPVAAQVSADLKAIAERLIAYVNEGFFVGDNTEHLIFSNIVSLRHLMGPDALAAFADFISQVTEDRLGTASAGVNTVANTFGPEILGVGPAYSATTSKTLNDLQVGGGYVDTYLGKLALRTGADLDHDFDERVRQTRERTIEAVIRRNRVFVTGDLGDPASALPNRGGTWMQAVDGAGHGFSNTMTGFGDPDTLAPGLAFVSGAVNIGRPRVPVDPADYPAPFEDVVTGTLPLANDDNDDIAEAYNAFETAYNNAENFATVEFLSIYNIPDESVLWVSTATWPVNTRTDAEGYTNDFLDFEFTLDIWRHSDGARVVTADVEVEICFHEDGFQWDPVNFGGTGQIFFDGLDAATMAIGTPGAGSPVPTILSALAYDEIGGFWSSDGIGPVTYNDAGRFCFTTTHLTAFALAVGSGCGSYADCDTCTADPACGWCDRAVGATMDVGLCRAGDADGPSDDSLTCPGRWSFDGECECDNQATGGPYNDPILAASAGIDVDGFVTIEAVADYARDQVTWLADFDKNRAFPVDVSDPRPCENRNKVSFALAPYDEWWESAPSPWAPGALDGTYRAYDPTSVWDVTPVGTECPVNEPQVAFTARLDLTGLAPCADTVTAGAGGYTVEGTAGIFAMTIGTDPEGVKLTAQDQLDWGPYVGWQCWNTDDGEVGRLVDGSCACESGYAMANVDFPVCDLKADEGCFLVGTADRIDPVLGEATVDTVADNLVVTFSHPVVPGHTVTAVAYGRALSDVCKYPHSAADATQGWVKTIENCVETYTLTLPVNAFLGCGVEREVSSEPPTGAEFAENVLEYVIYTADVVVTVESPIEATGGSAEVRVDTIALRTVSYYASQVALPFAEISVSAPLYLEAVVTAGAWDADTDTATLTISTLATWPYKLVTVAGTDLADVAVATTAPVDSSVAGLDCLDPGTELSSCFQEFQLSLTPEVDCQGSGSYNLDVTLSCRDNGFGGCVATDAVLEVANVDVTSLCAVIYNDATQLLSASVTSFSDATFATPRTEFYLGETIWMEVVATSTGFPVLQVDFVYALVAPSSGSSAGSATELYPSDSVSVTRPTSSSVRFGLPVTTAAFPVALDEADQFDLMIHIDLTYADGSRRRAAVTDRVIPSASVRVLEGDRPAGPGGLGSGANGLGSDGGTGALSSSSTGALIAAAAVLGCLLVSGGLFVVWNSRRNGSGGKGSRRTTQGHKGDGLLSSFTSTSGSQRSDAWDSSVGIARTGETGSGSGGDRSSDATNTTNYYYYYEAGAASGGATDTTGGGGGGGSYYYYDDRSDQTGTGSGSQSGGGRRYRR